MKLVPPSSSAANPDLSLRPGALVMYENDGSPGIGAVIGFRKQSFLIFTMRGRELEFKPNRLQPLGGTLPSDIESSDAKAKFLLALYEDALKDSAELNLEEIHSLVVTEGSAFTSERLSALYYGKYTVRQFVALRLALLNDRIFFKRKADEFTVRPPEIIEELRKSEDALARKLKLQEIAVAAFAARIKDKGAPLPPETHALLETLEELAAGVTDFDHGKLKDAKEFLTVFGDTVKLDLPAAKEKRALFILRAIGHFTDTTNLAAIRYRVPVRFSQSILEAAAAVTLPRAISDFSPEDAAIRQDLTRLRCVTIDDIVTRDMDDALSVEQNESGYELGIHISDVTSLIPPGSPLDLEARKRTTSLYLAGQPVNMLPEPLAEGLCSLVAGEVRPAISYLFQVDRNFEIKGGKIVPSLIKVSKRLTYSEVVTALEEGDHDLTLLHNISATYESARIEKGAMKVSKKEILIYPKENGGFILHEIDEDDPARALVSELMVLANSLAAEFAMKNKIPMAFRGQEQPEDDLLPAGKLPPEGPAYDFYLRSRLKKSQVGLTPIPHASLGLPAYIQCTSPIRRYMDLVHERQLLSFLTSGKPFYTMAEMRSLIEDVEPRLSNATQVSKETRRYWLVRYLRWLQQEKLPLSGIVVRLDGRTPLVELETLYSTVFARLRPEARLGDRVQLRILQADPEQDYLKLEQI